MKIILKDVVVNQVSDKEVTNKSTGEITVYRNVDIFIPRDTDDPYSKSKAFTCSVVESPSAIAAFNLLKNKEGQRATLEGIYQAARSFQDKQGKTHHYEESFKILSVIDAVSIKSVELPKMKAAA